MEYPFLPGERLFRPGEKIYIQKSSSLPEFLDKLHYHNYIELTYVTIGECEHAEGDENFHARVGDMFIIDPGVPHANYRIQQRKQPFVAYDIAFRLDFLDGSLPADGGFSRIADSSLFSTLFAGSDSPLSRFNLKNKGFYETEGLIMHMLEEYTDRQKGYCDILRAQLIELIIRVLRKNDDALHGARKEKQQSILQTVSYIRSHYMERITLEELAAQSCYCKSYYSQSFKAETGLSFSDFLQKIRIEHACEMLCNTEMTIAEIAEQSGFNDLKFFYTVFKKITNSTPAAYRDNKKQ